ncbi:hypothetical protein [Pimelobacter sp. 30-1]|uniref:hypothetical protein n=1 Tax=Pimelobacter sp. 30-1 TaxID=2004991 RepID=UPI001C05C73F|nr:hypothetical protein [Pimelobacter sp. 30-1]
MLLYDQRGCAPVFVVDLDSSKATAGTVVDAGVDGVDGVDEDLAAIEALMDDAGLSARFSDRSVSGGRHLYVPLRTPVSYFEARQVAVALEELFATVDAMPMRGLTDGCIRPPGAWHRRGGHQVLDGPIEAAEAALDAPNDDTAWHAFAHTVLEAAEAARDVSRSAERDTSQVASRDTSTTAAENDALSQPPDTARTTALAAHGQTVALFPLNGIGERYEGADTHETHEAAGTATRRHSKRARSPLSSPASVPHSPADAAGEEQLEPLRGWTEPAADYQHIARTGEYDPEEYRRADGRPATDSDVRQRLIWSCVAAGWEFGDVVRRLHDGTWRGLAGLYARYSDQQRHGALRRDWRKAVDHERRRRQRRSERDKRAFHAPQESRVRTTTTSGRKTQRARAQEASNSTMTRSQVERFVREWLAAVELLSQPTSDLTARAVLYTFAALALSKGTVELDVGNRSLAIGADTDNGTVSRLLRQLLNEPSDRALLDHVQNGRGIHAHVVALRIPPLLAPACAAKPWRRGRIHGIRAAFRELGRAAAFVYDVLEQLDEPAGGRDIAARARLSPSATYEALQALAAWGLATRVDGGWTLGDASLAHLAELFGIDEAVRAQIQRYRDERRAWWTWLVDHGLLDPAWIARRTAPPPQAEHPPPPAPTRWTDDTSCVELLQRELDAVVIAAG